MPVDHLFQRIERAYFQRSSRRIRRLVVALPRKNAHRPVGRCLRVCALDIIMKDPAYFIIARVDLAGGSTSWYRARLIQSAFEHLPEWWFAGTDYTRDWMWVVVSWSTKHTDITSHFIQLGVWGGLPLLFLFLWLLWKGFAGVAYVVRREMPLRRQTAFQVWTMGAMLFAIAITGLSVSYFDQSFVFIFLALGVIGSAASSVASAGANVGTNEAAAAVHAAASGLPSASLTQAKS